VSQFPIENLVALPMQPSIRVRVGPDETVEVDQVAWEEQKGAFIEWALGLPRIDQGIGYRMLKPYTGGNGLMAKLVVALGDLAKIWRMYPSPDQPALWGQTHPTIFQLRGRDQARRVPKPSAGDLDPLRHCECCERGMGPEDSQVHDLVASDENTELCLECDLVCGPRAGTCELTEPKEKRAHRPPETREEELDEANVVNLEMREFESYANQFGE
tara:strand:+ start:67 stop:711 length:645 start_codon:yes stop_codon:yes gene_type:complete